MFSWLIPALISTFFWATSNIVDSYLVREKSMSPLQLVVLIGLFSSIPGIFLITIGIIPFPPMQAVVWIFFAAITGLFTYLPYYYALVDGETESIVFLWNITPLITAGLAYFILGEKLTPIAVVGLVLLVISVGFVTIKRTKRSISKYAVWSMLLACGLGAVENISRRGLFGVVPFFTGYAWVSIGGGICALFIWMWHGRLFSNKTIIISIRSIILTLILDVTGVGFAYYAASVGFAAYVSAVGGLQPLMVVVIGTILTFFKFSNRVTKRMPFWRIVVASILAVIGLGLIDYIGS